MGKLGIITLLKDGETEEIIGEMSEVAKGWLMAFQEVEGSKMLTFRKCLITPSAVIGYPKMPI